MLSRTKSLCACALVVVFVAGSAFGATEQAKRQAINDGLVWLAGTQAADGHWNDPANGAAGYVASSASAALAFIEEGYLPGNDVIIDGTNYGDVVGKAVDYVFGRASVYGGSPGGSIYFASADNNNNRSVYTTGIATPVVYALGNALGKNTVIGRGSATINSLTYNQALQGVMDWYTWGQNGDGGWRYYPNYGNSDNSTAQWGALSYLYGRSWGLATPASVVTGLTAWTNQVQHAMDGTWRAGGSGYTNPNDYVNMTKAGGIMLEFAVMGLPVGDTRVQNALSFMRSTVGFNHWMQGAHYSGDQWYGGNLNNPYAMWAVYKALETYGMTSINDNGTPGDLTDDFLIGQGIATAPGGITIGQDWGSQTSLPGDWYSHYCDYLVGIQNGNGSWSGYQYWRDAMATGWYINILNAKGAPEPIIPEPLTVLSALMGVGALAGYIRRRRTA